MESVRTMRQHTSPPRAERESAAQAQADAEAQAAASAKHYNDLMMSRLRRAVAPPPTKEQLAAVVDAMMKELMSSLQKHGARLPAKKSGACAYQIGRRMVHLAVDSGRLVVKSGGGHVDLLEFIERNKMCVRVE